MVALGIILLVIGFFMMNWVGRQYAKSEYERPMIFHNVMATAVIQLFTWGSLIAGAVITFMKLPWLLAVLVGGYVLVWLFSKKSTTVKSKAEKFCDLLAKNRIKMGLRVDFAKVVQLTVNQYGDFYNWTPFNKSFVYEQVLEQEADSIRTGDWVGVGSGVLKHEYHNQMDVKHKGGMEYLMSDKTFNDLKEIDMAVRQAAEVTLRKFKL